MEMTPLSTNKTCNKCGVEKPIESFYRRQRITGVSYDNACKKCRNKVKAKRELRPVNNTPEYREKRRQYEREKDKRRQARHKEKCLTDPQYLEEYREKCRQKEKRKWEAIKADPIRHEAAKEKQRRWLAANPEIWSKKWESIKNNPSKLQQYRQKNVIGNITYRQSIKDDPEKWADFTKRRLNHYANRKAKVEAKPIEKRAPRPRRRFRYSHLKKNAKPAKYTQ